MECHYQNKNGSVKIIIKNGSVIDFIILYYIRRWARRLAALIGDSFGIVVVSPERAAEEDFVGAEGGRGGGEAGRGVDTAV